MDSMITVDGRELEAVICPLFGCKIYPASHLEAHLQRHDRFKETVLGRPLWMERNAPKPKSTKYKPRPKKYRLGVSIEKHLSIRPHGRYK